MAKTKINNVAYSWSMIRLQFNGLGEGETSQVLNGVSEIKWNRTRKTETNYGIGGNPINRGFGNKVCTASIVMDYNTVSELRAGVGSLMELGEFDIVISFVNDFSGEGWQSHTVTLKGCLFTEEGFESKQDDTNITHEYQLNPFNIITSEGASENDWL